MSRQEGSLLRESFFAVPWDHSRAVTSLFIEAIGFRAVVLSQHACSMG